MLTHVSSQLVHSKIFRLCNGTQLSKYIEIECKRVQLNETPLPQFVLLAFSYVDLIPVLELIHIFISGHIV